MQYINRQCALVWFVGLSSMLIGPRVPSARAQPESLADWSTKAQAKAPIPSDRRVTFGGQMEAFHTGDFASPGDDQVFANFYQKRIFPYITDPAKRGEREDVILKLHNDYRALAKFPVSPVRDKLTEITLEYMAPIAKDGKWPPAVRENALLAIGEVKSPQAVPVLLDMIKSKELHQMFKVVAMADLVHLAEQGVLADEAVADPVVKLMAVAVPRKIPNDGWRWMRGQAADILAAVGNAGNNVPDALLTMLADEDLPLIIRGKAARALGKLKYNGNAPDAANYTKAFAQFGSDALSDNLPSEARRIWAVCNDFLAGLDQLMKQGAPPKTAHDIQVAMDELRKAASKATPEEDLKPAIAKARKTLDAAAKKK